MSRRFPYPNSIPKPNHCKADGSETRSLCDSLLRSLLTLFMRLINIAYVPMSMLLIHHQSGVGFT